MARILTITMNPAIDVSTAVAEVIPAQKLRCAGVRRDPGGGGINVARVARRLGSEVTAFYPIGGCIGQLLRRLVEKENIRSIAISIRQETREDFTALETATGNQFRFVLPGPQLSRVEWVSCLDAIASFRPRPDFIAVSGSLPPGAPTDFYAQIAAIARHWAVPMALDTSGPPLKAATEHGVDILKPNLRELRELTGKPLADEASWLEACRTLVAAGKAQIVALTLGHRGALLVTCRGAWRAGPLAIKPASTVGAGDSFLGAMIWALSSGRPTKDAFRYGVAAGSAALLAPGTELCYAADVRRLFSQVDIKPVARTSAAQQSRARTSPLSGDARPLFAQARRTP